MKNKMIIPVTTAIGHGKTELAAFDAALYNAGVADRNLVRLSSVIPPNTEVNQLEGAIENTPGDWGDRLHVVYAEQRTSIPGDEAWAGIGWMQDPSDGRGLFVEHEGHSREYVTTSIDLSLDGLAEVRGREFPERNKTVVGVTCTESGLAVCALAVAVYQASSWDNEAEMITRS